VSRNIDGLLKLAVAASIVLAALSAGYYHAIYLPQRDARIANERLLEQANAEAAARAARLQLVAQEQDAQKRQAAAQATAEADFQSCLKNAGAVHDASWAAECKRLADRAQADLAGCLANGKLAKAYCDSSYGPRDASANCTLPAEIASPLDADLAGARNRCLRDKNAAAQ
jgi:hypothetical protein